MKTQRIIEPSFNSNVRLSLILAGIAIALLSLMALLYDLKATDSSSVNTPFQISKMLDLS